MDIQLEKYKLIEWLINFQDESIISQLKHVKNGIYKSSDWTDDISKMEKLLVEAGLKDIAEENILTHEQVMNEINDTYGI